MQARRVPRSHCREELSAAAAAAPERHQCAAAAAVSHLSEFDSGVHLRGQLRYWQRHQLPDGV